MHGSEEEKGVMKDNLIVASNAVAFPNVTREAAPAPAPRSKRLRVVNPNERHQDRGRFNRYTPWGSAPFFVLFDLFGLVIAGTVVAAPWFVIATLTAVAVGVFAARGQYRPALNHSALNWIPETTMILAAVIGLGSLPFLAASEVLSPGSVLVAAGVALLLVILGRAFANLLILFARTRRLISHNVLVLGAGEVGTDLVATMRSEPKYGLMPVGYYDPSPKGDVDMPTFDSTQDIMKVIDRLDAAAVIVAFSTINDAALVPILRACDRMSCEIFVVPRLFELLPVDHHQTDHIGTTSLVRLRRASHRSASWQMKRLFDIVVSASGLIALSPIMLLGALGSWKENGWPVLFRQERVGLDGKAFNILKFQSMRPVDEDESQTNWNIGQDDRVGPISRFLRVSSIDELPQLWNVLRGDMSLVGPRPERPHFVGQFSEEIESYSDRHRVPSGLTGFAQVEGLRGDTSIRDRARYDNAYVESWSLWTDIKILLRSVVSVVTRRGS